MTRIAKFFGLGLLSMLLIGPCFAAKPVANNGTLVVLTANWCATCREIIPAVQRAATSLGDLPVVTLDVDNGGTPEQANQYGVSISGSDIPEVYFVKGGKTTMVFNGRGYRFGHADQVQNQIQQEVQSGL